VRLPRARGEGFSSTRAESQAFFMSSSGTSGNGYTSTIDRSMPRQKGIVLTPYLVLLVVIVIGVLGWRLAVVTGQRDVLEAYKTHRIREDAARDMANLRNKERTDEEHIAARKRAATAVVRVDGPGIKPRETVPPGSGDDPIACFDRRKLNEELAGLLNRHAERLSGIAREGEGVAADFRACKAWALSLN